MDLNDDQQVTLRVVSAGHNFFITGQAGSGKSRLVSSIRHYCRTKSKRSAVVFLSGIACTVYPPLVATTVHSFFGLGSANLPSCQLSAGEIDK